MSLLNSQHKQTEVRYDEGTGVSGYLGRGGGGADLDSTWGRGGGGADLLLDSLLSVELRQHHIRSIHAAAARVLSLDTVC